MTCRSLLRHCKTGLDIWVFREMGYTHVYPPHCQCNRENDDKLLGLGVVYVQTNPRQWKNACNPLPPCPSVDGHQPCSPTCLGKNLGGWNITNGFIFPARSVQEISKPHHLHHHGVWKNTSTSPIWNESTTCKRHMFNPALSGLIILRHANHNYLFLHLRPRDWMKLKLKAWRFISSNLRYMALPPHQRKIQNWRYDCRGYWTQESAQAVLMFFVSSWLLPHYICSTHIALIGGFITFHSLWKVCSSLGIIIPVKWLEMNCVWNQQPLYSYGLYPL